MLAIVVAGVIGYPRLYSAVGLAAAIVGVVPVVAGVLNGLWQGTSTLSERD
mgnify:CR=1 FL=1